MATTSSTTSPTFATMSITRAIRVTAGCDTAFVTVTLSRLVFLRRRAIGAVVARFVHTEEVTGSNPVSPTSITAGQGRFPAKGTGPVPCTCQNGAGLHHHKGVRA